MAVILAFLFLLSFLVTLIVSRVNTTVLSADFYIDQLRKADVFTFLYDEVFPTAVDQMDPLDVDDVPMDLRRVAARGMLQIREVLPPQWLEEQTELVIGEVIPYLMGDTDGFAVTILVADRLESLGNVVKREVGVTETHDLLFDDVISPVLEQPVAGLSDDLPLGITLASEDIIEAIREVMPPEWVLARTEHVVDQIVPYLTGGSQHFAIQIPVADRVEALAPASKQLLVRSNVYNVFTSQDFADEIDERLEEFGELPFGVRLTSGQIVSAVQDLLPPEWLQTQVEHVLDEVVPYLAGKQEGFEAVVPLNDRLEAVVPVIKRLLRDADAYELMFDQVIVTLVEDSVGQLEELPFGAAITADEIVLAMREVLPPEFVQEQAESMIDEVVPFATGEAERFAVVVPLADRKEAALQAIEKLAIRKLDDMAASLRPCTLPEALALAQEGLTGQVPLCRPTGFGLEEIKRELGIVDPNISTERIEAERGINLSLLTEEITPQAIQENFGIDVAGQVRRFIGDALPDQFTYTDVDLRDTLSQEDVETLDRVLDWTRNGFIYTAADLREDLAGQGGDTSNLDSLDQLLEWSRQGLTYSDADLQEDLAGQNGDTSNLDNLDQLLEWTRQGFAFSDADLRDLATDEDFQMSECLQGWLDVPLTPLLTGEFQFECARDWLGLVRSLQFLLFLVPALLLVEIGFLGGRHWRSRIMWAAVPLGIAAGVAFVIFGPIYHSGVEPVVEEALAEINRGETRVQLLVADKLVSIAETAIGDIGSGLANRAAVFLSISVIMLAGAILWPTLTRFFWSRAEKPAPEEAPKAEEDMPEPTPQEEVDASEQAPGEEAEARQATEGEDAQGGPSDDNR